MIRHCEEAFSADEAILNDRFREVVISTAVLQRSSFGGEIC